MGDAPLPTELFRALAEASSAITFIYQGERNVYANPAAERATGYTRAELAGLQFWDIIHPDCRDLVRERGLARQRGEPVPPNYEVKIVTKSGEARWLDFTGAVVEVEGEAAVLGTAFDITERVRVGEALRVSEAEYRRLVDNSLAGVMRTNLAGEILFANQATLRIFGCESLEELQEGGVLSRYQDEAERDGLLEALRLHGHVEQFEVGFLRRSGEAIRVEASVSLEGGVLSGVLLDVSERKLLEQEALRGQKLESLALLAGGLAHDFNNFLAAILSNLSLVRRYARRGEDPQACLEEAEQAVLRARDLTHQLLTFARGGELRARRVNLRVVLQEAVEFALRGSKVSCAWELPERLPPVVVDVGQIQQVLHNLVLNAVQAMPQGGSLHVSARDLRAAKRIQLAFRDEGPGISPEDQARIFDPYFTTKPGGSGLGLATVHAIVKRHGGDLRVESTPGRGACFLVELNAATGEELAPAPLLPDAPQAPRPGTPVLIMDDDVAVLRSTSQLLGELGYAVTAVSGGEEALDAHRRAHARGEPFAVLLLDLTIPGGVGGAEVLAQIRTLEPDVRALLVTGYASESVWSRCQALGFAGVLDKPFTASRLATCLRECLD